MNFKLYIKTKTTAINKELARLSSGRRLIDTAMRYSLMAGGKRLRPVLAICAAEIFGARQKDILPAACALEYIHTYSLIHDDLPAMDNDDLRRGKPTSHKKFGEATAILSGDALLTEAFSILGRSGMNPSIKPQRALRAVEILAEAAGRHGMIAGQMNDTVETSNWRGKGRKRAAEALKNIHLEKTAALIRASLKIGAVLAGAVDKDVKKLDRYGECIGLAFQITDDILDIEGNKKLLGKKGSDLKNKKLTYPAVYGLNRSKKMSERLIEKAKRAVKAYGRSGGRLSELADFVGRRTH